MDAKNMEGKETGNHPTTIESGKDDIMVEPIQARCIASTFQGRWGEDKCMEIKRRKASN